VKSNAYKEKFIRLNEYINKQPKFILILLGILLVIVLGIIDYLLGWEISFVTAFLIPIAFVTWFVGRNAGVIFSFFSAAIRLATMFLEKPHYSSYFIPFYNVSIRLTFFLIIAYLLSALKTLLERERYFSRFDYLTGLANKRQFDELANVEIQRALRYKHQFTVVYMDIDYFKIINDRFGHHMGNILLSTVAKSIKKNVRTTDVVARIGGDEFTILMPETGRESAEVVVNRLQKDLLDIMQRKKWPVTFSFGVVTVQHPPNSINEILKMADELMYFSKFKGTGKINYKVLNVCAQNVPIQHRNITK